MKVSFDVKERAIKNPDLIDPLIPVRLDICPFCKAQRIEVFSFNGYPQNYRLAVDEYMKGNNISYDKYEIRSMKCRSCNKEFTIDWINGMPTPLRSSFKTNLFFQEFINGE